MAATQGDDLTRTRAGSGATFGDPALTDPAFNPRDPAYVAPGHAAAVADRPPYPESASSDEIRRDIDETRGEMDRTLDELGERLRPRNLFDELTDTIRDRLFPPRDEPRGAAVAARPGMGHQVADTAGQIGRSVLEAVREHPLPAALIGGGIAWLLFEDRERGVSYRGRRRPRFGEYGHYDDLPEHSGSFVDARTGRPYDDSYGEDWADDDGHAGSTGPGLGERARRAGSAVRRAAASAGSAAGDTAQSLGAKAGDAAHGMGEKVGDLAHEAADKARELAGDVADTVKGYAGEASHLASRAGRSVRRAGRGTARYAGSTGDAARRYGRTFADRLEDTAVGSRERFQDALEDKPLAVGAAALAAGLLVGLAVPHTRLEDELCGDEADEFKRQARRRGEEALAQGKQAAAHVADAALGDAEKQGLSAGTLADKAAKVAGDALKAAKESAKEQGLDPATLKDKAGHVAQTAKKEAVGETQAAKNEISGGEKRSETASPAMGAETR